MSNEKFFKEAVNFRDISWLMSKIDIFKVLERSGIKVISVNGDEIMAYCPDHEQYTGRKPSHPKWSCNVNTGFTKCWTEDRGSNIVYTICRIKKLSIEEAVEWILEKPISIDQLKNEQLYEKLTSVGEFANPEKKKSLDSNILNIVNKQNITKRLVRFFMIPPKKKPTCITEDTIRHFKVTDCTDGTYKDRAIVPFYMNQKCVGFTAIDILGEEKWLEKHPGLTKKQYKKVLFLSKREGFYRDDVLFGFDDVPHGSENLIIVEGPRDAMKLWQEGFHSVSILGTHISSNQTQLLSKINPKKIIIMLDGGEAEKVKSRKYKKLLDPFFNTQIIDLPSKTDPKNLNKEQIEEYLKKQN